jgi:hypothetical protein
VSEVGQAAERAFLSQEAGVGPADIGPGIGVAGALDDASDVEPPALGTASRIAETLEGNSNFDLVAPTGDPALRLPGEVGIGIGTAGDEAADLSRAFAADPVALNSQRIHPEEEGPSPVVEGVEVEHHVIVVVDVVAIGNGGADRGGMRSCAMMPK